MLTPGYWISALLLAAVVVCWAYVLVQPGMLLAPVQARLRAWHKQTWAQAYSRELFDALPPVEGEEATFLKWARCHSSAEEAYYQLEAELDNRWWWKPLWGCYVCVAGQAGFWGYLLLGGQEYRLMLANPSLYTVFVALLSHLGFTAITISSAALLRAFYAWSQSI